MTQQNEIKIRTDELQKLVAFLKTSHIYDLDVGKQIRLYINDRADQMEKHHAN